MLVLGLDTTGPACSAALVDDAIVLAHISEPMTRGHAERLAPMAQEVLLRAGKAPSQIDRIAVCTGPGSFTGQRVAISFAKGFALPRKIPVVGVNALQVMAQHVLHKDGETRAVMLRDIRRDQVFAGAYRHGLPIGTPRAMSADEAQHMAKTQNAKIYDAGQIDTRVLAWIAADLNPQDYPAAALYSRPPDAKLPSKPKRA